MIINNYYNTDLSAEDLIGKIVVSDSGDVAYIVYVRDVFTVSVSGPSGDHPSRQVSGLLPEGLSLRFLLSDVDRLATPADLANLKVAERLSECLPEEALIAFQGLVVANHCPNNRRNSRGPGSRVSVRPDAPS